MAIAYEYRPGSLYLNVTNRCSNACTFCVRQGEDFSLAGYDLRLRQEPDAQQVLDDIERQESLRGEPFEEVVFCGFGEPTYRLELIAEVGRSLRARQIPVRLNTNGQAALIAGKDPLPLLAGALDSVSISLNAPDAQSYLELCRPRFGRASYDAVISFAERAAEAFDSVVLSVVGYTLEPAALKRCAQIAASLGTGFRVR